MERVKGKDGGKRAERKLEIKKMHIRFKKKQKTTRME